MPSGELVGTTLKFTGREVTDGHSHFSNTRFLIIFLTHLNVLRHLLCLHLHLHPLDPNLLLARDAIINPPAVGVKRRRDGGG
jgi:hypothetical protein